MHRAAPPPQMHRAFVAVFVVVVAAAVVVVVFLLFVLFLKGVVDLGIFLAVRGGNLSKKVKAGGGLWGRT